MKGIGVAAQGAATAAGRLKLDQSRFRYQKKQDKLNSRGNAYRSSNGSYHWQ